MSRGLINRTLDKIAAPFFELINPAPHLWPQYTDEPYEDYVVRWRTAQALHQRKKKALVMDCIVGGIIIGICVTHAGQGAWLLVIFCVGAITLAVARLLEMKEPKLDDPR